jgi:hypothetical protein
VWRCESDDGPPGAQWSPLEGLSALPSVFLKAARAGLSRLV